MRLRSRSEVRSSFHTRGKSSTSSAMAFCSSTDSLCCSASCCRSVSSRTSANSRKRAFQSVSHTSATRRFSGSTRKKRRCASSAAEPARSTCWARRRCASCSLRMQFFVDLHGCLDGQWSYLGEQKLCDGSIETCPMYTLAALLLCLLDVLLLTDVFRIKAFALADIMVAHRHPIATTSTDHESPLARLVLL